MIISASFISAWNGMKKILGDKIMSYYPQKDWINQDFRMLYAAKKENSFVKDWEIC